MADYPSVLGASEKKKSHHKKHGRKHHHKKHHHGRKHHHKHHHHRPINPKYFKGALVIPKDWSKECKKKYDWCEAFLCRVMHEKRDAELFPKGTKPKKLSKKELKNAEHTCKYLEKRFDKFVKGEIYCSKGFGPELINEYLPHNKHHHHHDERSGAATDSHSHKAIIIAVVLVVFLVVSGVVAYCCFFRKKKEPKSKDDPKEGSKAKSIGIWHAASGKATPGTMIKSKVGGGGGKSFKGGKSMKNAGSSKKSKKGKGGKSKSSKRSAKTEKSKKSIKSKKSTLTTSKK